MKQFLEDLWFDFLDSGIPAFFIFAGIIAAAIMKPMLIVYGLAVVGVIAIVYSIYVAFNFFN
jgi:hypothetical protein